MNHTDVISKEVVDRLRAIGTLGERVAQDRITPSEALQLSDELLFRARLHLPMEHPET